MILKKDKNFFEIDEPIGEAISACLVLKNDLHKIMLVNHGTMIEAEKKDIIGRPIYFSYHLDGDKTKFKFWPTADKDYEIRITFFPAIKIKMI